ncbi:hypothetical protein Vadar_002800 [Vaccinium darrowii]|uniref:Uncharacterized protein n=1 Tax=Vaccinium darrowii TaxID=229202 RepID=A0ACB7XMP1_9ERIC|nr:hypothetical protein Vadar_002800 [Vaccinium darrowii]
MELCCRMSVAIPIGVVSYMDIDGYRYKRDVLFCHDVKLPEGFIPENQGEKGDENLLLSIYAGSKPGEVSCSSGAEICAKIFKGSLLWLPNVLL